MRQDCKRGTANYSAEMDRRNVAIQTAVASSEYTLAEVGRMFGLSRERVRTICLRRGITSRHRVQRIDRDDKRLSYWWSSRNHGMWRAHEKHRATRRQHLAILAEWKRVTGRDRIHTVLLEWLLGSSVSMICFVWGKPASTYNGGRNTTCVKYTRRLFRLAGVDFTTQWRVRAKAA